MAAIHGKDAILYLSPGSGAAVEVAEQVEYSIEMDFDTDKVTELGDSWDSFVKGIQRWSGSFSGNFNTASNNLFSAATATTVQNFYLYPQRSVAGAYYYGTAWVKLGKVIAGGIAGKATSGVSLIGDGALSKQ